MVAPLYFFDSAIALSKAGLQSVTESPAAPKSVIINFSDGISGVTIWARISSFVIFSFVHETNKNNRITIPEYFFMAF